MLDEDGEFFCFGSGLGPLFGEYIDKRLLLDNLVLLKGTGAHSRRSACGGVRRSQCSPGGAAYGQRCQEVFPVSCLHDIEKSQSH